VGRSPGRSLRRHHNHTLAEEISEGDGPTLCFARPWAGRQAGSSLPGLRGYKRAKEDRHSHDVPNQRLSSPTSHGHQFSFALPTNTSGHRSPPNSAGWLRGLYTCAVGLGFMWTNIGAGVPQLQYGSTRANPLNPSGLLLGTIVFCRCEDESPHNAMAAWCRFLSAVTAPRNRTLLLRLELKLHRFAPHPKLSFRGVGL
jgi:hypothetical protein